MPAESKAASQLAVVYLALYNALSIAAWSFLIHRSVSHFAAFNYDVGRAAPSFYDAIGDALKIVQTAALLEILHAASGLVRASALVTFLQVFGRLNVLWGATALAASAQRHWSFSLMAAAWAAVEIPRYTFYLWKLLADPATRVKQPGLSDAASSNVPYFLTWLRYSMFIVLYPAGIIGELGQIFCALPLIERERPFSAALPNTYNFAFDYYIYMLVIIALYVPAGPFMCAIIRRARRMKKQHPRALLRRSMTTAPPRLLLPLAGF